MIRIESLIFRGIRRRPKFGIGIRTAINWVQRFHETGSVEPDQIGGYGVGDPDCSREHRPVCCGVELDPLYVDVMIRRYETSTGTAAILADSDETFEQVATRQRDDDEHR